MAIDMKKLIDGTIGEIRAERSVEDYAEAEKIARKAALLAQAKEAARDVITGLTVLKERKDSKFEFRVREGDTGVQIVTNIDFPVGPHGGGGVVTIAVGGDDRWSPQTVRVYGRGELHIDGAKDPEASEKVVSQITRLAANWGLVT